jgi:hypothetical protein
MVLMISLAMLLACYQQHRQRHYGQAPPSTARQHSDRGAYFSWNQIPDEWGESYFWVQRHSHVQLSGWVIFCQGSMPLILLLTVLFAESHHDLALQPTLPNLGKHPVVVIVWVYSHMPIHNSWRCLHFTHLIYMYEMDVGCSSKGTLV